MAWGSSSGEHFLASNPPSGQSTLTLGAALLDYGGAAYNLKHQSIGCKGDGTTHDDVGLQTFANLITTGVGVPAVAGVAPAGVYSLYAQVVFYRKAIILRGAGTGNPTDTASNPGKGTTFRWMGSAGVSMIQVQDARSLYLADFYMQGNDSTPPLAGLEFFQGASDTIGVNRNLVVSRVLFGYLPWNSASGTAMTYCVAIDGTNANNQMHFFDRCQFNRPLTTCVYIPNSQSIWCGFLDNSCDGNFVAKGIVTSASTTMYNAQFGQCTKDMEINSTANVSVFGWYSENSAMIFDLTGDGSLNVKGGVWTIMAPMQGLPQIAKATALTDNLTLEGVRVVYQITPKPPLVVTGAYSPVPYTIRISACKGLNRAQLTLTGYGAPGVTYLDIQNDSMNIRRTLAGALAASAPNWSNPIIYVAPTVFVGLTAAQVLAQLAGADFNDSKKHTARVSVTITITTLGSGSINARISYTDDSGTARTDFIPLCPDTGVWAAAANTAKSWKGTLPIAFNPNLQVTVDTVGTFTGCTYNASAAIETLAGVETLN